MDTVTKIKEVHDQMNETYLKAVERGNVYFQNKNIWKTSYGGRNAGQQNERNMELQYNFNADYYLGDGIHYFKYRLDKNNSSVIRATLFFKKDNSIVPESDLRVTGADELNYKAKDHHRVIEYYEVFVMYLNQNEK